MNRMVQTAATLSGMVAVGLLMAAFRVELRNVIAGTADSALALAVPFLVLCAVLATFTSAGTGLVLHGLALLLLILALMEGAGAGYGYAGLVAILATIALTTMQRQMHPKN